MKKIARQLVLAVLSWQVRRLYKKNDFTTVAVVGSYGKTSTKFALASALSQHFKVRYQAGNYNDIVTVPLIYFGEDEPSLMNPLAWLMLFVRNERQLHKTYPYEVVVLEIGIDKPGQMAEFGRYVRADITVVTSIALEHMENLADIDEVAHEELAAQQFSDSLLVNDDLCDKNYYPLVNKPLLTYGMKNAADYILQAETQGDGYKFTVQKSGAKLCSGRVAAAGRLQLYSVCVSIAVGDQLGMPVAKMASAVHAITTPSGRMQRLKGIKGSTILDETYNASPEAVKAALDTLYEIKAPQKIAVLGNMNELGDYSPISHQDVGEYCDPGQLDMVLTIGPDANKYLAKAAEERGCEVQACRNANEAGEILQKSIKDGAAVLVKGSQNGVFAEEAVKMILADPADAKLLVRQSDGWLNKKQQALKEAS